MIDRIRGVFGTVVVSQSALEVVTVVTKNLNGQVVMRRFGIATLKAGANANNADPFRVVAFEGDDFRTGNPRDMGGGMTKLVAMAIREDAIAAYIQDVDQFKARHINDVPLKSRQRGLTVEEVLRVQAGHTVVVPREALD